MPRTRPRRTSTTSRSRPPTTSAPSRGRASRPTGSPRSDRGRGPYPTTCTCSSTRRGRRARPRGSMLTHSNTVSGVDGFHAIVPDIEYRIVSFLLPMSHLFEQAIGLYLTLDLGADILYVRTLNPRILSPRHPRAPDDRDDRRAPVPGPRLVGAGARDREAGPDAPLRARPLSRATPAARGPAPLPPVPADPRAVRRSACASSYRPARSSRRPCSRRGRTLASS